MSLAQSFAAAERGYESHLTLAAKAAGSSGRASSGGPYAASVTPTGPLANSNELNNASRQYRAGCQGIPFTAIRPIAVKVADQPIMAGVRRGGGRMEAGDKIRTKDFVTERQRRRALFANDPAPAFIRKQLIDGLEPDPNHPLLDVFENPNPYMDGWSLRYASVLSIVMTGVAYWWLTPAVSEDGRDTLGLWYLPTIWVTPIHTEDRPFVAFKIQPPGVPDEKAQTRPADEFCRFAFVDPANPLAVMSPLQSQARAVNIDDEIQIAQFASVKNGVNPGMILSAGHLPPRPNETGQGPRIEFTPEQRKQILDSVRLAYAGARHFNDPLILDALIQDAYPYTRSPAELAFPESSQLTKDRIMQGIGTNPIVAGQVEGANRATAAVAQDNFNSNVVNPIITLMSNVMTRRIPPKLPQLANSPDRLYIWIEEAKAFDADLKQKQMDGGAAAQCVTKNEYREYLGLPKLDGPEGEEWAGPPPPPEPEGPAVPGANPKPKPKPKPAAANKPTRRGRKI